MRLERDDERRPIDLERRRNLAADLPRPGQARFSHPPSPRERLSPDVLHGYEPTFLDIERQLPQPCHRERCSLAGVVEGTPPPAPAESRGIPINAARELRHEHLS